MNIEPLEARIAPAAVTVSYTDIDGDLVKITDSTGHLSTWYLHSVAGSMGNSFQLGVLDLADPIFSGANITFAVTKVAGGDGLAHVGYINATGVDLGDVKLVGDLGAIDAGSGGAVPAVKSLTVRSIGLFGTATGAPDLISSIVGALGALTVTTDVKDAIISVADGMKTSATIGAVKIGGSLLGGLTTSSGVIQGYGGIASVTIGGNLVGGAGIGSGGVVVNDGAMGAVTLGGSLLGGAGTNSGQIDSLTGGIGAIKIGGNVHGDVGAQSGKIDARTSIVSLTVGGSVIGGNGSETYTDGSAHLHDGQIYAGGTIGRVTVAHDVHGGAGDYSAAIHSSGRMGDVIIGGSVIGVGVDSGAIEGSAGMGVIKVAHDVKGGGDNSGRITSGASVVSVTVGGSVIGGTGDFSGLVAGGTITIGHDLLGGAGQYSGRAFGGNNFSVIIGGSLVGGTGTGSGGISASHNLDSVKIGRDLIGASIGSGQASITDSGYIFALQHIGSIEIGGSIISGTDSSTSGSLFGNATIRAGDDIGSITVKGDIAGNQLGSDISSVVISARGQATPGAADVAIGKITVGHRVEQVKVLAGYIGVSGSGSTGPTAKNADAQIGTVSVGGDWIASDLVAGVKNISLQSFGDSNDAKISGGTDDPNRTSKIGSITIAGRALGAATSTGSTTDNRNFGFVAETIGSLKVLGRAFSNLNGIAEFYPIFGLTNLAVHEIAAPSFGIDLEFTQAKRIGQDTVIYGDLDGDLVTVKFSMPLLTSDPVANSIFKFSSGSIGTSGLKSLQEIDLTGLAANGMNITVTVKRGTSGDGLADIGYIDAGGINLGTVTIPGDLGQIDAGASNGVALKSLKVRSLGRLGITSQPPGVVGGFIPDLISSIQGPLGALTVTADVKDAQVAVSAMAFASTVGPVTIGGSLLGGRLYSAGDIGAVKIGGSIAGGGSANLGSISAAAVSSVTIGGSVVGGTFDASGQISTLAGLGPVTIAGNLVGGTASGSGSLLAGGAVGSVKIGGSLLGSALEAAGTISGATVGVIAIGHDLLGGVGLKSGSISVSSAKGVTVGGSLIGGGGIDASGSILTNALTGAVKIGHNLLGGAASLSGAISATALANLTIGGSVVGGGGGYSASITSSNGIGALKIGHDLTGGGGANSALITSAGGLIKSVTIGGSLLGGTAGATGGIFATGSIGSVKIGRDVQGGSVTGSAAGFTNSGSILAGSRLGAVAIGGSLIAGLDNSTGGSLTTSGSIRAGDGLAGITVTGSLLGRATANGSTLAIVSARGPATASANGGLAIAKVSIAGTVSSANLLAGFDLALAPNYGSAQIGSIQVGGNWLASNAVAGAQNFGANHAQGGGDDNLNFGDSDDHIIGASQSFSKIASIVIRGSVAGTAGSSDHFGFVAKTIGSVKMARYTAPLTSAPGELISLIVGTGDVALHEV